MRSTNTTKYLHRLFILSTSCILMYACATQKKVAEISPTAPMDLSRVALFSYGEDSVRADDFLFAFQKNNADTLNKMSKESLDAAVRDYLKLYVNFKLKVKAAYAEGMAESASFKQEYGKYSKQLAKPFMVQSRYKEMLVTESYERLKEEVSAAHILIAVPEGVKGVDTLQYFQKADSIRKVALDGQSFAMLAEKYSDDPSADQNGGNLGYFSSMQMVYPFETAAYHTNIGDISEPVRTNFGYHIIKVNDRRPYQGKVKVAHIMIRFDKGEEEDENASSYKKALQIYNELKEGAQWEVMTERYSEDLSTRSSGGEFPYFTAGGSLNSFEETAFRLEAIGAISKPVKTRYGWHIIKLLDRKGLEPFEMLRALIERKVEANLQQLEVEEETVTLLKKENNYQPNASLINQSISFLGAAPEISKPNRMGVLFSVSDTTFTYAALQEYLDELNISLPVDSIQAEQLYQDFEAQKILAYEEAHLAEKYPEYRRLAQEYKEGILLFDIMEKKVWAKASENEELQKQYYQQHQEEYRWKDRVEASILEAKTNDALIAAEQLLMGKKITKSLLDEVENKVNQDTPLNLQLYHDIYEKGAARQHTAEKMIDEVSWKKGRYEKSENNLKYLVIIHDVLPPSQRAFEEVKGKVISDLQDQLDQEWIAQLRNTYPVEIDESVLAQVIQRLIDKNE